MTRDPVRAIADAVLYEGYILWPYRRSALKNQRRFGFGGVYPPAHSARHPDDADSQRTEVLVQAGPEAEVQITVRFLHVVSRTVTRGAGATAQPVHELTVAGERYLSWQEAVQREVTLPPRRLAALSHGHREAIDVPAGQAREALSEDSGAQVGALVRSWRALSGEVIAAAQPLSDGLWRLTCTVRNATPDAQPDRERALEQTFCSTHTLLHAPQGRFVSLADPPAQLAQAAAGCHNVGTWPVPVGDPGDRSRMLSSPIILEDYPRIAPESPGDLFDGGEIDQLLVLNILALTDEEKSEMAASDPRAREILQRTEALTPEQLMALHGAVRELSWRR